MTPAQIKKMLKGYLDELDDDTLKSFRWYLRLSEREGTQPLTRSKLENITREDTVDILVEAHTIDHAVEATGKIFAEMNLNDLASKLARAQINSMEQQSHEPMSSTRKENQKDTPFKNIKEKREAFEKVRLYCDSLTDRIKSQCCDTEKKVKDEFEKFHLFLKKEEDTRLAALKEEETRKIRTMQLITEMSRNIFSLSDFVKEMEDSGADVSFLQTFKMEMERTQTALPNPHQLPQALINVPKHLENLQHKVLAKVLSTMKSDRGLLRRRHSLPWTQKIKRLNQHKGKWLGKRAIHPKHATKTVAECNSSNSGDTVPTAV